MKQEIVPIISNEHVSGDIYRLSFSSPYCAGISLPGQFINVKINQNNFPLLRRPFSIHRVDGDVVSILFNIVGEGTRLLSNRQRGDSIDIIGPLGNGFEPSMSGISFNTIVIAAGGLGVAPFPFFCQRYSDRYPLITCVGGRTRDLVVSDGLINTHIATDDGSVGMKGTVVEVVNKILSEQRPINPIVVACGPNAMLRALGRSCTTLKIPCLISLECEMACGIGLCQGCPVETLNNERKYLLVCKDGPVFNSQSINVRQ